MQQYEMTVRDLRTRLAWAQGELAYQRQLIRRYEEMLAQAEELVRQEKELPQ